MYLVDLRTRKTKPVPSYDGWLNLPIDFWCILIMQNYFGSDRLFVTNDFFDLSEMCPANSNVIFNVICKGAFN